MRASREKTRLCIVMASHWAAHMGGAQYQAKCILDVLIKRPDLEIFYLARRTPDDLRQYGYEIVRFGSSRRGVGRFLTDLLSLYRALRRLRPAVVYQRGLKAYTGACALYCARHRARLVFHIAHDSDVSPARFAKWGPGTLVRRLERRIAEYGLRRANVIVAQTSDQVAMLRCGFGLEATAVVPNFHPIPAVDDSPRGGSRTRIIWVANFKKRKNPEIFVDMAEAFSGRRDVEFVMIGRAGGQAYARLHERMKQLGNLEYLGELPIERVNEELARSDIFVNTSSAEGFPNTFIQAWLRGTPVVSCFVDPDGCLSRGNAGIFAGGPERLISVVGELLDNPERIRELGESARAYGYANHHPDRAQRLVELLLSGDSPCGEKSRRGIDVPARGS
jgi:glycosyltransferase involved in cell wall biosynthesis